MAKLMAIAGTNAGREYPLGELSILGRSPNAQIRLGDWAVSRHHAKITRMDDGFIIEDLCSTSGTAVNDHYITVSRLRPGDEIAIGAFRLRFVDEQPGLADANLLLLQESKVRVLRVDETPANGRLPLSQPELLSRLDRRLGVMLTAGQAVSRAAEPGLLLEELTGHCLRALPSGERAFVAIPDRERHSLVVRTLAQREGSGERPLLVSRALQNEVLNEGHAMSPVADGTAVVCPLICQGQMLGIVCVDQNPSAATFTGEDLEVLSSMAPHLALALQSEQQRETLLRQLRTEQELTAAHEVQKRFLPRGVPKVPGFTFVAHYAPCRDVGGDLYDFIPLGETRLGVVIGDVSGKGFGAAIVVAWLASQLKVAAHQADHPAQVIAQVNESLLETHQDELFVTLIYGVLDWANRSFCFCNAGHVPPLVRRSALSMPAVEVAEREIGLPIGVVAGAHYGEGMIRLEPGDALLLVTDGVTEAMNMTHHMFGLGGLAGAVARSLPAATRLVADVLGALRSFVAGAMQYDDITMVSIGVETSAEDVTMTLPPRGLRLQ